MKPIEPVTLFSCMHRDYEFSRSGFIRPVLVGSFRAPADDDYVLREADGENVAHLNPFFCELTALYHVWKNVKGVEVVGLCHYRRYFDFQALNNGQPIRHLTGDRQGIVEHLASPAQREALLRKLAVSDFVVPPLAYTPRSLKDRETDSWAPIWTPFIEILCHHFPKYQGCLGYFDEVAGNSYWNMFATRWSEFDAYCSEMFPVLFELHDRLQREQGAAEPARVIGGLSELFLGFYAFVNRKRTLPATVVQF